MNPRRNIERKRRRQRRQKAYDSLDIAKWRLYDPEWRSKNLVPVFCTPEEAKELADIVASALPTGFHEVVEINVYNDHHTPDPS